jgi:hypothetical protein
MRPTSFPSLAPMLSNFRHFSVASAIFLTVSGATASLAAEVETHPGISLEPMYAEAVIAYNSKQPGEALRILDNVLKAKADYIQALELKSLVLKDLGKPRESQANYERLIKATPPAKAGPYHFELAVLYFNQGKGKEKDSIPHFEEAIRRGFNVTASHFFLGLAYFSQGENQSKLVESEKHFNAVAVSDSAELKPASHYYLGLINFKRGYGSQGTQELIEARGLARSLPDDPMAKDISKAVDAALAPYGKGQWFGNISLLQSFNGNVSSLPNSATLPELTSGEKTFQTLLVAGLGRMSSPLNAVQWVASYRGGFNLNYNSAASAYQFLTHTFDVYLTAQPLARTNYGIKFEGNFSMSDQGSGATGSSSFQLRKYSLTGEFGPYLRSELKRGLLFSMEAFYRPQNYFTQPDVSGNAAVLRSALNYDRSSSWWNPGGFLSIERNRADGAAYRYYGAGAGINDQMRLNDRTTLTGSISLNLNQYLESDPQRFDKLVILRLSGLRQLTPKWSLVADASYQINYSNQSDLYYYTQPVVSFGAGYSF